MKETISLRLFPLSSFIILFLSTLTPAIALPTNETEPKICQTEACKSAAQNFKDSMDTAIDPCDNFYQHVCQNWWKQHNTTSSTYFTLISSSNQHEIRDFVQKNDTEDEPEIVHRVRKIYSQCVNQDKQGVLASMNALLQQIVGIPAEISSLNETESFDYIAGLAKFSRRTGLKPFFELDVAKNPYNRASNVFHLRPLSLKWGSYFTMDSYEEIIGKNIPKRSLANHDQQIPKQCDNISSLYCQYWRSDYTSVSEFLIEETKRITDGCGKLLKLRKYYTDQTSSLNASTIYVPRTLQDLQDTTNEVAKKVNSKLPVFNWTRYIEELFDDIQNVTLDLKEPGKVEIITTEWNLVRGFLEMMHTVESPEHIKYIIWYTVLSTYHSYIRDSAIDPERKLGGIKLKDQICFGKIVSSFGMALTYVYSSKPKYKKAKMDIRKMSGYIKQSTKERVQQSSWLDEKTKEKALKKLDLMKSFVVYPNFTKSSPSSLYNFYSHVNVARNFFETMIFKEQAEYKKQLSTLNQPNDLQKDSGETTPNEINAFYNRLENSLNIPAAIVEDPLYNADSLAALNYGAIGSILGHELGHGLDSTGRQFNEYGDIENWWQEETLETFKTKEKCFVKTYATYDITSKSYNSRTATLKDLTLKGDSKQTLGEDISDNEGFKSALFAYKKYIAENGQEPLLPQFENYTHEQLFTISFANAKCENPSESDAAWARIDLHSPSGVRVNGVLKNSQEFAEIWKCPKGSNMNPNVEKCSVW